MTLRCLAGLLPPLLFLGACASAPGESRSEAEEVFETVFVCPDGPAFLAILEPQRARLALPEGPVELRAAGIETGTGAEAHYAAEGFDFRLEEGGEAATLARPGAVHAGCLSAPERLPWERARLRGAILRAIGQEPGWWLEIRRDATLELATGYGSRREVFEAPAPEELGAGRLRYALPEAGLTVLIEEESCQDVMSGWHYPLRVSLETPSGPLVGCGRRLE